MEWTPIFWIAMDGASGLFLFGITHATRGFVLAHVTLLAVFFINLPGGGDLFPFLPPSGPAPAFSTGLTLNVNS